MSRRVTWVVLCEDEQHYAFARRFLDRMAKPALRECYKVLGPGHAGVRARFGDEVAAIRKRGGTAALLAIVDADQASVEERRRYVMELCVGPQCPTAHDPVAVLIPERNIETWIAWLSGREVDATTCYLKLRRERDCDPAVLTLKGMCDAQSMRLPAPPSLEAACREFQRVLRLLQA